MVTDNEKKVTVLTEKTCYSGDINPREGGKYILFCDLPGQIDQIPLSIRGSDAHKCQIVDGQTLRI